MGDVIDLAELLRCKTYDELNQYLDEIDGLLKEIEEELNDLIES